MFDKLIESEPEGADFKNRRTYFMVSSLVVGVLFTTAVVISIFAADFGLGSSSFELSEMIAPDEMAAVEPEKPQPRSLQTQTQAASQIPTRQVNMARIDGPPRDVPTEISVVPSGWQERPQVPFNFGPGDTNPENGSGRDTTGTASAGTGLISGPQVADTRSEPEPEPPPIKLDPPTTKKPVTQSLGVINGRAMHLPKPVYSVAAKAVHAQGKVDVQVMIDENGKVVSANALNGHPLLRGPAEQAARNAKFSTTYLSNVPVKVTGVIVYNFIR